MISRRSSGRSAALAIASDGIAISVSWTLSSLITGTPADILLGCACALVFLTYQLASGSYRLSRVISASTECGIATRSYMLGIATMTTLLFFAGEQISMHGRLLLFFLFLPPVYLLSHFPRWYRKSVRQRKGEGKIRTMVLAEDPESSRLPELLRTMSRYHLVAMSDLAGSRTPEGWKRLVATLRDSSVDLVLLASSDLNGSVSPFEHLERNGVAFRIIPSESEFLYSDQAIHDLSGIPLSPPGTEGTRSRVIYRTADLITASVLLILLSPLLASCALLLRLSRSGPIMFRQKRSMNGMDGHFVLYKFRSMNEETRVDHESLRQRKTRDDPRVTALGGFMRRYSIDELPQLINILKGEMSLVGPRPLPDEDFAMIREMDPAGTLLALRSGIKPGLTGLWQTSGRSDLGFREMMLLDLYYIEHRSLLFDLEILLRTIPAVLFGKGAY